MEILSERFVAQGRYFKYGNNIFNDRWNMFNILAIGFYTTALILTIGGHLLAGQNIIAAKVNRAPVIDGRADDPVWEQSRSYLTQDKKSGIAVTLKAVYTDNRIFFLVRFPDQDESTLHKDWVWNPGLGIYEMGSKREDTFVFKWSMSGNRADLSLESDKSYRADIWFWKANRTDPSGFADDKIQQLTFNPAPKTKTVTSRTGKTAYLSRRGDEGDSAYKSVIFNEYQGDRIPRFKSQPPSGSRADILAKGLWQNHQWTIEFSRRLNTGHLDDIQFDPTSKYLFGISRYEIAGRKPDPALSQPLYGCGDISENLFLIFGR
ncbi:hypothetical protein DSCO28_24350 [Desulfosarcina ovata subsp. sediminis]|uniref:Cytochrome c-552/DMSO reductase-like haem-binding domain-containing protein n=1 Tax=Desulfosarcina ovata subsp. sediminis TaxID=885957 RepID=A0A5K7ZPR6_9BACT|nr:hypothetical protein DSCO28_24350 [Desulfosarcina ovata subsp. sediminis]